MIFFASDFNAASSRCKWFILLQMVAANGCCKLLCCKCLIFAANGCCKLFCCKWPILVVANDSCKWPKFRGSAETGLLQMTIHLRIRLRMANQNVFDASLPSELKFPDTKSPFSLKSSHLGVEIKKEGLITNDFWDGNLKRGLKVPKLEKAILQTMGFQKFKWGLKDKIWKKTLC